MSFMSFLKGSFLLQGAPFGGNGIFSIGSMVLIFAIFYFLLIRPQRKEQKKMEKMISETKKGDKVITIGGIHGVITSLKEKTVVIKVDDSCRIEINRNAIGAIVNPKPEVKSDTDKKIDEKANN